MITRTRLGAVLGAALAVACGGTLSDEPPLTRCEFRSLEDGGLFICVEAEDADDPTACSSETAAKFPDPVSATPASRPCSDSGKAKGCYFRDSDSTVWGYGPSGAEHVDSLCSTVSGGVLVEP